MPKLRIPVGVGSTRSAAPLETKTLVIAAALLLHGLGHGGALGALIWIKFRPGDDTGARLAALAALASTGNVREMKWIQ